VKENLLIRTYSANDREEVIALLQLNIPQYFDPSETKDFKEYLEQHLEDYFVVEDQGAIIGAGGINYFPEQNKARISWDFIHPDYQGKGVGKQLLNYRIARVKLNQKIKYIEVRTSQMAFKFYKKVGFELETIEKDFWAKGFNLYLMKLYIKQ